MQSSPSVRQSERLFRDLEKMYRVAGFYGGNLQPMEQHIKILAENLKQNLTADPTTPEAIAYDFLMGGVYSGGKVAFAAETPETTFSYALFCEGVQTLLVFKNIEAQNIVQFCLRIRKFFSEEAQNGGDLASILWRESFPNIKVYIYSLLMETLQANGTGNSATGSFRVDNIKASKAEGEGRSDSAISGSGSNWLERDEDWELPIGELVKRVRGGSDLDELKLKALKQDLGDAAVSDRTRQILGFNPEEVEHLRREFEAYDENQVQFNLLVQFFSVLKSGNAHPDSLAEAQALTGLADITASIVKRFHGGLLVFLLSQMDQLRANTERAGTFKNLETKLREALVEPDHLDSLADAFAKENRRDVAEELCGYLPPNAWGMLLDAVIARTDRETLTQFLKVLIVKVENPEQLMASTELRLSEVLQALSGVEWAQKGRFFLRAALLSKSQDVIQRSLGFVHQMPLKPEEAIKLFNKFAGPQRKKMLETLIAVETPPEWGNGFVDLLLKSESLHSQRANILNLISYLSFKWAPAKAWSTFSPTIRGRRLIFWPKSPLLRESILAGMMQLPQLRKNSEILEVLEKEQRLRFQSADLKEALQFYLTRRS